jgi:hypothetical protein
MVLPEHFYGDPANLVESSVWELRELARIRDNEGCKACKHSAKAWERHYCKIGKKPRPRYCKKWEPKQREEKQ